MTRIKFIFLFVIGLLGQVVVGQNLVQQKVNYYISQAKLDSARIYIEANLETIKKEENKSALNYQLVKVLFMQSQYDEALQQAFYSLDAIEDEKKRVNFNFMIGCIYSAISDYDTSITYFDLVVQHNQDPSLNVQTHLLLSQLHIELEDDVKAGASIAAAYDITNNSSLDSKLKNHVAMQYNYYSKNYELCKAQNFKIIKDTTSFLNAKSYAYAMIGDCLVKQDSLIQSTSYFDEFLKLTFETKDPEQIKVAANKLIDVYEKLGNQEKANTYHKIYNEAINDSSSFSAEKYRNLYDVEKKRALEDIKAKNSKKYLIIGAVLVGLISIGIYFFFRRKNQKLLHSLIKTPGKKLIISDIEIVKIKAAINKLEKEQLFLKQNITRKSFCAESDIKSERYLSQYINDKYKKSFSVFISDLRIKYAHTRILNDSKFRNYKIEEIAKASGFGSKKSFERAFAATYGDTPYKLISKITI